MDVGVSDLAPRGVGIRNRDTDNNSRVYPKKVGVIFLIGEGEYGKKSFTPFSKKSFNPLPCAHLLLQLNAHQNMLNFQIISLYRGELREAQLRLLTARDDGNLFPPFNELLNGVERAMRGRWDDLHYWIGITTMNINTSVENGPRNSFYEVRDGVSLNGSSRRMAIITSSAWEEFFSPPSLFEYVTFTSFKCALNFISRDLHDEIQDHKPSGCIFDFTYERQYYRISMSNPHLCPFCKSKLRKLEVRAQETDPNIQFCDDTNNILSLNWLGDFSDRKSPLYSLKRNYRYDVDRNSGFNKKPLERFRDSIVENSAEWIIGGIIATALSLVGAYLSLKFGLGS